MIELALNLDVNSYRVRGHWSDHENVMFYFNANFHNISHVTEKTIFLCSNQCGVNNIILSNRIVCLTEFIISQEYFIFLLGRTIFTFKNLVYPSSSKTTINFNVKYRYMNLMFFYEEDNYQIDMKCDLIIVPNSLQSD